MPVTKGKPKFWNTPEGYNPSAYCVSCGKDFSGDWLFDRHRIGNHEYTYEQGLTFNPPLEDGRRCMTIEEMIADGMRLMTKEEMLSTQRHRARAKFDIEMWFDPSSTEALKQRINEARRKAGQP